MLQRKTDSDKSTAVAVGNFYYLITYVSKVKTLNHVGVLFKKYSQDAAASGQLYGF